jgi:hypothetical protein
MKPLLIYAALAAALTAGLPTGAATGVEGTNINAGAAARDAVVARGRDFEIRQSDLDQVLATMTAKNPSDQLPPDAAAHVLSRLLEIQLVWQKATDAEKAAGAQYADERWTNLLKSLGPVEVEHRLHVTHMTADDLRRSLARQMTARESLTRQLGITVTDADLRKYYDDYPAASEQPAKARIRELLLLTTVGYSSRSLPEDTVRAKHRRIFELYQRVRAGGDFATLARQYNEDPVSQPAGGELPPFSAPDMEFGNLAMAMQTNQISDVLTNEDGYRIFQLLEKIPAKKFTFAAVTNKIKAYIIAGRTEELAPPYIRQLRAAAEVEILDPGLKALLATADAEAAATARAQAEFQTRLAAAATNAPPAKP